MKKQMANSLILSLILIFACGMQAYSQEEIEKAKAPFRPSEPPRLYIAPTADIIPSLDLSIAGMYLLFQKRRLGGRLPRLLTSDEFSPYKEEILRAWGVSEKPSDTFEGLDLL